MEAEYIALSAGMCVVLHLGSIHKDVCTWFADCKIPYNPKLKVIQVFEDNQTCFVLATADPPRMTPCSKSIAIKHHCFRNHLRHGKIKMRTVKALPRAQFELEHKLIIF
jgi:hypothetical protein